MAGDGYSRTLANGPLDRKLLRAAADGLSAVEMARAVGNDITPAQARQRVEDLLNSRPHWTIFQEHQLILEDINATISSLRSWADAGSTKHIGEMTKLLTLKLKELERRSISPEDAAQIIREGQGRIFLQGINAVYDIVARSLTEKYQIPEAVVHEEIVSALPVAVQEIESRVERD